MKFSVKLLLSLLLVFLVGAQGVFAKGFQTRIFSTAPEFKKGYLKLAPDGKRVAFTYYQKGKHYVQVNSKVIANFEIAPNSEPSLIFSPDGKTLYYPFYQAGAYYLQSNNHTLGKYEKVSLPVFSKRGKVWGYNYLNRQKWYYSVNGVTYGGYNAVGNLIYAPGEGDFAFSFQKRSKWYIQTSKEKYGGYQSFWGPTFSLDGKSLGVVYQKSSKEEFYVKIDNKEYGPYEAITQLAPGFDGKSFEVLYQDRHQYYLRIGEKNVGPINGLVLPKKNRSKIETANGIAFFNQGTQCLQLGNYSFTGFSGIQTIACGAKRKAWGFAYQKENRYFVQINEAAYGPFDAPVSAIHFSPNEKAFAFVYKKGRHNYLQVNDQSYPLTLAKDFAITQFEAADIGKVFALQYRNNGADFVRVNQMVYGGRGTIYPNSLVLSNNGRCFGYRFRDGKEEGVQINDKIFKYDSVNASDFVITSDNRACFAHVKNGRIVIQDLDYN